MIESSECISIGKNLRLNLTVICKRLQWTGYHSINALTYSEAAMHQSRHELTFFTEPGSQMISHLFPIPQFSSQGN